MGNYGKQKRAGTVRERGSGLRICCLQNWPGCTGKSKAPEESLSNPSHTSPLQLRWPSQALTQGLITNLSWNVLAVEAEAGGDVQAVHRLQPIVTLRRRDVDGGWEEDGDVHRNDGSRPVHREREVT